MPYCRSCGASIDETAQFCSACGASAGEVTSAPPPASPGVPERSRLTDEERRDELQTIIDRGEHGGSPGEPGAPEHPNLAYGGLHRDPGQVVSKSTTSRKSQPPRKPEVVEEQTPQKESKPQTVNVKVNHGCGGCLVWVIFAILLIICLILYYH
jgi:hypothetical protein